MDRERSRYLKSVESRFLELRGRGLMLSPRDVMLVDSWRQRGVPVQVVIGALQEGSQQFLDGRPHGTPLPASLAYFASHVDKAHRERLRTLVEGGALSTTAPRPSGPPRQSAQQALLGCVETSGRSQSEEAARQALRAAWRRLAQAPSDEAWWDFVMRVDRELIDRLESTLDDGGHEKLEAAIERAVHKAGGPAMGDQGRRDVADAERDRWLRERFNIRDLMEVLIEHTM